MLTVYGDGLVAVGNSIEDGVYSPAVWTSGDGLTWSRVTLDPSLVNGRMNAVASSGTRLVAVGCVAPTKQGCDVSDPLEAAAWTSDSARPGHAPLSPAGRALP